MSKLPTVERPARMDPELAEALEGVLKPYTGEKLEVAQAAVMRVRESGLEGSFGEIVEAYREAVKEAVAA